MLPAFFEWGSSSVWQSAAFAMRRSGVRSPSAPPQGSSHQQFSATHTYDEFPEMTYTWPVFSRFRASLMIPTTHNSPPRARGGRADHKPVEDLRTKTFFMPTMLEVEPEVASKIQA